MLTVGNRIREQSLGGGVVRAANCCFFVFRDKSPSLDSQVKKAHKKTASNIYLPLMNMFLGVSTTSGYQADCTEHKQPNAAWFRNA